MSIFSYNSQPIKLLVVNCNHFYTFLLNFTKNQLLFNIKDVTIFFVKERKKNE